MNRRQMLRALTGAAGGVIVSGCVRRSAARFGEGFGMSPVRVSPDRIIGTLVGLRPYRPGGFVVRTDRIGDRLIIHNYGHGGAGVTLSWGTAELVVEETLSSEFRDCAVLGCGAIGLSTGILLQRRGWQVTIYARDLPPNTTSDIAGALWLPTSVYDETRVTTSFRTQYERAARLSHQHFRRLVGSRYGARWVYGHDARDGQLDFPPALQPISDLFPGVIDFAPDQHPFPRRNLRRFTTMYIETPVYMPAIERDFRDAGGQIVVREFQNVEEVLDLPERVVINCTGLGAHRLFGDDELIPAKGQLTMLLPQPDVDYTAGIDGGVLYMHSRQDAILLGGSFEPGVWDLAPNPVEADRILGGHTEVWGSFR
jgi:D-amino-acid oxidase